MPPRFLLPGLRVMRWVSCALIALLPVVSTHAQSPVPAKVAPATTPVVKAPSTPGIPGKPPAKTAPPALKPSIAAAALSPAEEVRRTFKDKITPFIKTYCYECHGDRKMKGGVTFHPALKNPSDPAYTRRWKMGLATVNAHDMPPDDADKQPSDAEREEFMGWVGRLKFLSPQDPGAFVIRRLTKTEYGNTLRDLIGVDPSIVKDLPDEVPGEGYLNTLSPLQMEQYLGIANKALSRLPSGGMSPIPPLQELRRFSSSTTRPAELRAEARQIAQKIARHAYRRPGTPEEIEVLLQVYDLAIQNKLAPEAGLELMLKAALVSPQFLYITPASASITSSSSSTATATGQGTTPSPTPEILPLDDWMLASRLSYLLWATMPDAKLSTLADQGKLHDPAVLSAQVARMLKDDRSRALFDGFGAQWLGLADLTSKTFDTTKFPQMATPALRQAMYDEARLFFSSIIRDNAPVSTFITADYTYLNAPLAALYGPSSPSGLIDFTIPPLQPTPKRGLSRFFGNKKESSQPSGPQPTTPAAPAPSKPASSSSPSTAAVPSGDEASRPLQMGNGFHRVRLKDPNRGGILGMPGILAVTSFPNRTSPVKRGVWVLEQILGEHIPPAPPNVPTLEKQDKKKIANLTLRQRTELHRTNVVCANCHKILDPIGFGLENFDAIGRWRDKDDTGGPIDAAGELPGGKRFSTPAELKAIIAGRKDDLSRNLTEKFLAYALCRQLEGYDEIVIDQLMKGIAKDSHRMQTLITAVVTSYPFMNRRIVETLGSTAAAGKTAPAAGKK